MVVFTVLIAAYVAIGLNPSFGWFAKNETVTANGMNTMAYHSKFEVTFADEQGTATSLKDILATLKVPGQSVVFDVTIKSIGSRPVDITAFGLEAPSVQYEVPKVEGTTAYYLSTELNTSLKAVAFSDTSVTFPQVVKLVDKDNNEVKPFLRDEDTNVSDRIDYFRWLKFEENKPQVITLNQNQSVTFTVEITFVKTTDDQNVFKNFAEKGTCMRDVFFTFDESR
jgi:hypothetical protein